MSEKISNLTDAQKILLEQYSEKWKKIATTTKRCNRVKAENAITKLYAQLKLKKPTFHWCASPSAAQKLINKKLVNKKQQIKTSLLGNHDASWVAFYLYCRDIGVEFTEEQSLLLDIWKDVTLNAGLWYAYDTDCFCVERPTKINFDESDKLKIKLKMVYSDGSTVSNCDNIQ